MTTKLGSALTGAAAATPSTAPSRFQAALATARPFREVVIPGLELAALETLIGTERELDIEGEVTATMERRGLEAGIINQAAWELERARRVLAEVLLDPDPDKRSNPPPIGTLADWGRVPKEIIVELWRRHTDFCEQHDPSFDKLTDEEVEELKLAVAKKNSAWLRSFGARRLASYLLTLDVPPASSPTPESGPGES
jgi:hypothetical protein